MTINVILSLIGDHSFNVKSPNYIGNNKNSV